VGFGAFGDRKVVRPACLALLAMARAISPHPGPPPCAGRGLGISILVSIRRVGPFAGSLLPVPCSLLHCDGRSPVPPPQFVCLSK
jgi:hypothetical protein